MQNIGIFCASSNSMDKLYYDEAARLGQWIGESNRTLVYGGANCGLMEATARAVHESGGKVIGVVPKILFEHHRVSQYIDEVVRCNDLNDRKQLLIDYSDVIVAMPGSVGTLDEVFTVLAANTIGIHNKKVIFWNIGGFWDDLITLFKGLERRGVVNKPFEDVIVIVDSLESLTSHL